MADETEDAPEGGTEGKGAKGGKKPLILGAAALVLCAAGAFGVMWMTGGGPAEAEAEAAEHHAGAEDADAGDPHAGDSHAAKDDGHGKASGGYGSGSAVAFVPVDPVVVTIGQGAERQHLRFASQLEVPSGRVDEVSQLMPRVVDALGGYLRALEPMMLTDRDAHLRIRGQMLRRVKLVLGPDAVHDLLVTEFVLN